MLPRISLSCSLLAPPGSPTRRLLIIGSRYRTSDRTEHKWALRIVSLPGPQGPVSPSPSGLLSDSILIASWTSQVSASVTSHCDSVCRSERILLVSLAARPGSPSHPPPWQRTIQVDRNRARRSEINGLSSMDFHQAPHHPSHTAASCSPSSTPDPQPCLACVPRL